MSDFPDPPGPTQLVFAVQHPSLDDVVVYKTHIDNLSSEWLVDVDYDTLIDLSVWDDDEFKSDVASIWTCDFSKNALNQASAEEWSTIYVIIAH